MLNITMLDIHVYNLIILFKVYWLLITLCLLLIIYLVNKLEPLEAQVKMDSFVFYIIFCIQNALFYCYITIFVLT